MKIKELLTDESKWTKLYGARNENNDPVNPRSSEAVCWCLIGAYIKCYGYGHNDEIYMRLRNKTLELNNIEIDSFNDSPTTTFADIRKLVEELDI